MLDPVQQDPRFQYRDTGEPERSSPLPSSAMNRFFGIAFGDINEDTVFACSRVKHLYDWWMSANAGSIPYRRQFDILDHRALIAHIFVTECHPDGSFHFRLLGEQSISMIGRNPKGTFINHASSSRYDRALFEYYSAIVAERRPKRCVGSLAFADQSWKKFESIDCPVIGDDGHVQAIIGVMDIIEEPTR